MKGPPVGTVSDALRRPTPHPSFELAMDFDHEFRLLEEAITARLHGRGLVGRLRRAGHLLGAACHDRTIRHS